MFLEDQHDGDDSSCSSYFGRRKSMAAQATPSGSIKSIPGGLLSMRPLLSLAWAESAFHEAN